MYVPAGVTAGVSAVDSAGRPLGGDVQSSEVFGLQVQVVTVSGLGGRGGTLAVSVDRPSEIGVATTVAGRGVVLDATVSPAAAGQLRIDAVVSGLPPSQAKSASLSATGFGPDANTTVALAPTFKGNGGTGPRTYTALIAAPAGSFLPVEVDLAGPYSRYVTTGSVAADGSAGIARLSNDRLVDTDGDGRPDELVVDVAVQVPAADQYHLAVDFRSTDGRVAFGAPAAADLAAGPGVMQVRAPVAALLVGGKGGPFELVGATLDRGTTTRRRVAVAASLGLTRPYDLASVVPSAVAVGRSDATSPPRRPYTYVRKYCRSGPGIGHAAEQLDHRVLLGVLGPAERRCPAGEDLLVEHDPDLLSVHRPSVTVRGTRSCRVRAPKLR